MPVDGFFEIIISFGVTAVFMMRNYCGRAFTLYILQIHFHSIDFKFYSKWIEKVKKGVLLILIGKKIIP